MDATPWRVVLITALPIVAQEYARVVRALGHEPVAVIVPRRRRRGDQPNPLAAEHLNDDPFELDLLFAAGRDSLPRLLRAYEPDLGLCAGFPWRIAAEALEVPRLGIV